MVRKVLLAIRETALARRAELALERYGDVDEPDMPREYAVVLECAGDEGTGEGRASVVIGAGTRKAAALEQASRRLERMVGAVLAEMDRD